MPDKNTATRWFLWGGSVGLVVALGCAFVAPYIQNDGVLLVLWPMSFLGMAEPSTLEGKSILVVLMYGGNFLLYGFLGILVSKIIGWKFGRGVQPPDSGSIGL